MNTGAGAPSLCRLTRSFGRTGQDFSFTSVFWNQPEQVGEIPVRQAQRYSALAAGVTLLGAHQVPIQ